MTSITIPIKDILLHPREKLGGKDVWRGHLPLKALRGGRISFTLILYPSLLLFLHTLLYIGILDSLGGVLIGLTIQSALLSTLLFAVKLGVKNPRRRVLYSLWEGTLKDIQVSTQSLERSFRGVKLFIILSSIPLILLSAGKGVFSLILPLSILQSSTIADYHLSTSLGLDDRYTHLFPSLILGLVSIALLHPLLSSPPLPILFSLIIICLGIALASEICLHKRLKDIAYHIFSQYTLGFEGMNLD